MFHVMHLSIKTIAMILTGAIRIYQLVISPLLPNKCRYNPTCSNYAIQVINEWGILKGVWLSIKRISTCHPCGGWGDDQPPRRDDNRAAK
jgi:uncharacterized protein